MRFIIEHRPSSEELPWIGIIQVILANDSGIRRTIDVRITAETEEEVRERGVRMLLNEIRRRKINLLKWRPI